MGIHGSCSLGGGNAYLAWHWEEEYLLEKGMLVENVHVPMEEIGDGHLEVRNVQEDVEIARKDA